MKKYEEIFNLLDSDGDGFISANKIEITEINSDLLKKIAPLLVEMEDNDFTFNLETFSEACERWLK
jgi:Ca2+-binding EF-hand superfamily protein